MKARRFLIGGCAALLLGVVITVPAWASIFGEENVTLVQILAQLVHSTAVLEDLSHVAAQTAEMTDELVTSYQRVHAGIETLTNYSFGSFLDDLRTDLYDQYPGFAKLDYASRRLSSWEQTRTSSPWTAYEAITAAVADVSAPLRSDLESGNVNIDQELILAGEASGGFAASHAAEQATKKFDAEMAALARQAQNASPGQSQQIAARAQVLAIAQQSHVMRLLSRAVRMDSVSATLDYAARMAARNSAYERRDALAQLTGAALVPPTLMTFEER